jgi:hypothetical protein
MSLSEGKQQCESFRTGRQSVVQNEDENLEKLSDSDGPTADNLTCGSLTHTITESHEGCLGGTR